MPPLPVDRPVMLHSWERLTFLHWRVDMDLVQRLLPAGLRVDTFDGSAWVGLVPFFMRVMTPAGDELPWASTFCETNVRTYVRDEADRPGIWFLSLDAARLGAVTVARTTYRLPYFWSKMRLRAAAGEVSYDCRRRWPGPVGAESHVRVRIGDRYADAELTELDHFLTARWRLFSVFGHRLLSAAAAHDPWPLHKAEVLTLRDALVPAGGLPEPVGPPLVHY